MALTPGTMEITVLTIVVPDGQSDSARRIGEVVRAALLADGHVTIHRAKVKVSHQGQAPTPEEPF